MLRVLLCFALALGIVGCNYARPAEMTVTRSANDVVIADSRQGTMWVGKVAKSEEADAWWKPAFLTPEGFREALIASLQEFGYLAASVEQAQLYVTAKLVAIESPLEVLLKEPWEILNERVVSTVDYTISRRAGGPHTVIRVHADGRSGWNELLIGLAFRKQWANERSAKANITKILRELPNIPLAVGGTATASCTAPSGACSGDSPLRAAAPR